MLQLATQNFVVLMSMEQFVRNAWMLAYFIVVRQ